MSDIDDARAALKVTNEKLREVYLGEDNEHLLYGALFDVLAHISGYLEKITNIDLGEPAAYSEFAALVTVQELIAKELG